jgi:chorismate dehydratase
VLKLGQIDFINALPLFLGITSGEIACNAQLVRDVPTGLNRRLREGELDLALVSCVEYLNHQERYSLLPSFGIAACGEVQSVILHVREELSQLKRIAVSSQSAASIQLIKILSRHFWHADPTYFDLPSLGQHIDYDGFLLIGDQALQHSEFAGYRPIDLAKEWYQHTRLPMVFALLVARREIAEEHQSEVADLIHQLHHSLAWGRSHSKELFLAAKRRVNLSEAQLARYFSLLRFDLQEEDFQGLQQYIKLSGFEVAA